jgi:hypothetical protein
MTQFHHDFWARNNHLHSIARSTVQEEEEEANFYKKFSELRATEFREYHRESWKRNFHLLKTGYVELFSFGLGQIKKVKLLYN